MPVPKYFVNLQQANIFMQDNREALNYSLTESYHPRYRKGEQKHLHTVSLHPPSMNEADSSKSSDSLIQTIFSHLNGCISTLQQMFRARMHVHEEEIIQIAHSQIRKMQIQTQKVVRRYNQLIDKKNLSNELLDLKYEVLYYQKRACQLFEENNGLKQKIKRLKDQIVIMRIGQESDHAALQNISKKYLKEKSIKNKLLSNKLYRDISVSERNNDKLLSLSKVYNPQTAATPKVVQEKGRSQPIYFSQKKQDEKPKSIKIKLKSLSINKKLATSPFN